MPSIFSVWEQQGWAQPQLEEQYGPDRTLLTLSLAAVKSDDKRAEKKSGNKTAEINAVDGTLVSKTGEKTEIKSGDNRAERNAGCTAKTGKLEQQGETLLAFMQTDQEYSMADFMALLELQKSRTWSIVKNLLTRGKLEAIGANRNRRYKKI